MTERPKKKPPRDAQKWFDALDKFYWMEISPVTREKEDRDA